MVSGTDVRLVRTRRSFGESLLIDRSDLRECIAKIESGGAIWLRRFLLCALIGIINRQWKNMCGF